jgi:hypothetical protein
MPRPRFTPRERTPGTHWTGGWVGPRAGLDTKAKRKILCPCRGSNTDRPARSLTLSCLSYRGSYVGLLTWFVMVIKSRRMNPHNIVLTQHHISVAGFYSVHSWPFIHVRCIQASLTVTHTLVFSQPWYREGGEAIALRRLAPPLPFPIFPSSLTVRSRLVDILRPVY